MLAVVAVGDLANQKKNTDYQVIKLHDGKRVKQRFQGIPGTPGNKHLLLLAVGIYEISTVNERFGSLPKRNLPSPRVI